MLTQFKGRCDSLGLGEEEKGDFTEELAVEVGRIWRARGPGKKEHPRQRKQPGLRLKVGNTRGRARTENLLHP